MEFVFVKKLVDEWTKEGHRCIVITAFSISTFFRKRIQYKPRHYVDKVNDNVFVDVYNPRVITTKINYKGVSLNAWISHKLVEKKINKLGIVFDFIYCHFFSSALKGFHYAQKNNIPFFIATGESSIGGFRKPYSSFTWGDFRANTNGVIAVSSKNKEEATKRGYIDAEKCAVFPNGTDLSIFHAMDRLRCRKKLNLPQDMFIISCVGFFCERKGQNRLLEAVRRLDEKNVGILFMGSAAKTGTFVLEGEQILFKGSVDNKVLPLYLGASDVFCLPTQAEGCCNAVIEALACGLPVISSNLPFNWDVLDDSNSVMINPNNVGEISMALRKLSDDVTLRTALSNGALEKSKSLDIHHRSESIMEFIKQQMNKDKKLNSK